MTASGSVTNRSRVTNGESLFAWSGDARTAEARRFRDILTQVIEDLGGADMMTETQRQMARRHALLATECERLEHATLVEGEPFDAQAYIARAGEQRRLAMCLGLQREAKPVNRPLTLEAHAEREGIR